MIFFFRVALAHVGPQDLQVTKVTQVYQECKALWEMTALRDHEVDVEVLVKLENVDRLGLLEMGLMATLVSQVSVL